MLDLVLYTSPVQTHKEYSLAPLLLFSSPWELGWRNVLSFSIFKHYTLHNLINLQKWETTIHGWIKLQL